MNALLQKLSSIPSTLRILTALAAVGAFPTAALAGRHHDERDRGRMHVDIDIHAGPGSIERIPAPPPVYEERQVQVWVEPVYQTVTERQWVEPAYRTVIERVWVPNRYEVRDEGRRGYQQRVLVEPGHHEDVPRQELVSPGHCEDVQRQELVTPGHWETRTERVPVAPPPWR